MPIVTETEIDGFAHCAFPRCPGNQQQQVRLVRKETGFTFRERGGTSPGVEASHVVFAVADEADADCPGCGKARELSDQPRKSYARLSGYDPDGLLSVSGFDAAKQVEAASRPVTNEEREEFERQKQELVALKAELAEAEAA